jgi:hypothetical protein
MNKNEIDTPTLIIIMFLLMALINGLMSCTTSKVYRIKEDKWSHAPIRSAVTGWKYEVKK